MISSLRPGGERLTGVFRSAEFEVPASLTFTITGHSGNPTTRPTAKLFSTGRRCHWARAEKDAATAHDSGVEMEWDLRSLAGHRARLEIVDGDSNGSFAWLAVGGFKPDVAPIPEPRSGHRCQTATGRRPSRARPTFGRNAGGRRGCCRESLAPTQARSLVAQAILANGNAQQQIKLTELLADEASPEPLRLAIATHGAHLPTVQEPLLKALGQAPAELCRSSSPGHSPKTRRAPGACSRQWKKVRRRPGYCWTFTSATGSRRNAWRC